MIEKQHHYSSYFTEMAEIITNQYLDNKQKSETGRKNFIYLINQMCDYLKMSPEKVTAEDIEKFLIHLSVDKRNRKNTLKTKHRLLSSYYRFYDNNANIHHIDKNFGEMVEAIHIPDSDLQVKDMNVVSKDDVEALLEYLEKENMWMLRLAVELAVRYGLTISRILRLQKEDLYQSEDQYYLRVEEKPNRLKKNIGLREDTVDLFLRVCKTTNGPIFVSERSGQTLSIRWMQQQLSYAGREITGFPITFNKLRNTCISYLILEGATYEEIELMTGSPASMLFRYRNYTGKLARAALHYKGVL